MSTLTPKSRFYPSRGARRSSQEDLGVHLGLKTVIGTTTSTPNAFDYLPENNVFAVCAGSAVIVGQVDADTNVKQRLFRARPNARSVNEISSYYNASTPPATVSRSRLASSLRDGGYGGGYAVEDIATESPSANQLSKRTRETTCISLSAQGNLLAVGERGKTPRVLIFSTAADASSEFPLSILTDHSFGVRSVAFSPDSRWLCSLGDLHDGFLYLWAVHEKSGAGKLQASNKCQNAHDIAWVGRHLVSFGTRHVKVWSLEEIPPASPSKTRYEYDSLVEKKNNCVGPKTFCGRNCLLGPLIDAVFTCLVSISDSKAILCTDQGDVCLLRLDQVGRTQRLHRVAKVDFSVTCVTVEKSDQLVWVAGKNYKIEALALCDLDRAVVPSSSPRSFTASAPRCSMIQEMEQGILAIGMVLGRIVTIDSAHIIEIKDIEKSGDAGTNIGKMTRLPAHSSPVLGVTILQRPNAHESDFLTWSTNGTVFFWTLEGACQDEINVELDPPSHQNDQESNELRVFRAADCNDFFVSGDKEGFLRLINHRGENVFTIKAHNGDVNDVAINRGRLDGVLVVSCGRDRTLQLFQSTSEKLILLQTILDHVASVNNVVFSNESTLLSASSDRTICVRTLAVGTDQSYALVVTRIIALKASPITLAVVPNHSDIVVISTMDRQIHKYDIISGRSIHAFKASDTPGGDSVILGSLSAQNVGGGSAGDPNTCVLLGVSSSDRSIRIYDYDTGLMLAKEHGQTVVSSIGFAQRTSEIGCATNSVVSTGLDGTVMIWDLAIRSQQLNGSCEISTRTQNIDPLASPISIQPLRRILSKAELSGFQHSSERAGDSISPTKSRSPSRLHKKTSRYNMVNTPKVAVQPRATHKALRPSLAASSDHRQAPQDRSPTPPSPKMTIITNTRRSSLDGRHRVKSTGNQPSNLNLAAEHICTSLRLYRKRLSSSTGSLKPHTAQELERELKLTIHAIDEQTRRSQVANGMITGDLLDEYLARMIDERLAIKAKSVDAQDVSAETKIADEASPPKG